MCKYANRCADVRMCRCANVWICKCVDLQIDEQATGVKKLENAISDKKICTFTHLHICVLKKSAHLHICTSAY